MRITAKQIERNFPPDKTKKQVIKVEDGSGLYLIIEPEGNNCKRFEGRMRFPRTRKGRTKYVPIGTWGKGKIETVKSALEKWNEVKQWSSVNNLDPTTFNKRSSFVSSENDISIKILFDKFIDYQKLKVKEITWRDRKNKLIQMLDYFGEDFPVLNFQINKGGKKLILEMQKYISRNGAIDHASRCRQILKQVFDYAMDQEYMEEGQNPASRKPMTEGLGHTPKSNPTIEWKEVPLFLDLINKNENNISKLVHNATNLYLMSCCRVGALVRLKWKWYEREENLIRIPVQTAGLKRKKELSNLPLKQRKQYDHLIPVSAEMQKILQKLEEINGQHEYIFASPFGKQYPHLNPETINENIRTLMGKGRLTAHGWRDVVLTEGQQVGRFQRDIILRQLGHTEHKQGASGAYDNTDFLPERRKFIEWWTRELVNQGLKI